MRRTALYSSSRQGRSIVWSGRAPFPGTPPPDEPAKAAPASPNPPAAPPGRVRRFGQRYERFLLVAGGGLLVLLAVIVYAALQPTVEPGLTQDDVAAAIEQAFANQPAEIPPATTAYAAIRPAVVRVENQARAPGEPGGFVENSVGSGVVIDTAGVILTNLHVVAGADRVLVRFYDGSETQARIVAATPNNDMAVLEVAQLPDGLQPATLAGTARLNVGDPVFAVGNPFDVGMSISAGVVSGLQRNYVSPEGTALLTNLIQFDAAANPGNSGGPLVTANGEVVGIVTGILNPTENRVFIGIGYAVPIETAASAAGGGRPSPF